MIYHISVRATLSFLVVDDDPDLLDLTTLRLRRRFSSCEIVPCACGEDALRSLAAQSIDAVLTDHHLGDFSSATFIAEARRKGVTCPIVVATSSEDPKIEKLAYEAGATRVFGPGDGDPIAFLAERLTSPPPR